MEGARTWLDNLKLRFSVGSAGNGAVDPYKYLSIMSINKSSVLMDGQYFSYTAAPGMQPKSLTWETATTYDRASTWICSTGVSTSRPTSTAV